MSKSPRHPEDFQAEIEAHLQLEADRLRATGLSETEARAQARRTFGNVTASSETFYERKRWLWWDRTAQDVRQALRGIRREPGFAAVAMLIMALGIGANTAVFTVVSPLLLRPLPFAEPQRLAWIETQAADQGSLSARTLQVAMFEELQRRNRSFSSLTAYFPFYDYASYKLTGRGEPEKLQGVNLAVNFFDTLGVRPRLGRGFTEADGVRNAPNTVVLSYRYWVRRLNADPSIVGQVLTLNGQPYTVNGVMGPDFDFASVFNPAAQAELYLPARLDEMRNWGNVFFVIGRLRPGAALAEARRELRELNTRIRAENTTIYRSDSQLQVAALSDQIGGNLRRPLLVLWGAVGLVLLTVCANLSSLLLARTAARSKELAVRAALGAGRWRLARQLITEGIVLATAGALLGLPLAWLATRYLQTAGSLRIPMLYQMRLDGGAVLFALALAAITGAVIGLAPVLRLPAGHAMSNDLRESSRGSTAGAGVQWARGSLVVAEIALAFVLVFGAGLLLRSFVKLLDVDLGFEPSHAVIVPVDNPREPQCGTPAECFGRQQAKSDEMLRRVESLPGIDAAALTDAMPLGRNRTWNLTRRGEQASAAQPGRLAFAYVVGPRFFDAMGIRLVAGRSFTAAETMETIEEAPVVINQATAVAMWPGEDPLGKLARTGSRPLRVVGVVADTRQSSLDAGSAFQMYLPAGSRYGLPGDLVVRGKLDAPALAANVRAALRSLDPNLVTAAYRPVADLVEVSVSPRRFLLTLITSFGAIALVLAALGIYGLVSYAVGQRTREIGIRVALGADPSSLRRGIVARTAMLGAAGVAIGCALGLVGSRFVAALLYATEPYDGATLAGAAAALLAVTALAGYVPALRASRVNPALALRGD
ncbi:MAG: ABC transporter permease [Bryobacterales bacterium]|nr:ABC transporter permease [Bryobacterales bacterium]